MPTVAQEIINNTLAFPKNLPCIRHISKNVNYFNPHLSLMYTVYAMQTTCSAGDRGLTPGEGNGNPLQHPCLGNPTDRGAWWATVHGVAKSWRRHSDSITTTQATTPVF